MGNFMGSYHWRTLGDLSTRLFTAANQAAMIALGNAAIPTRSHPGDIAVRTDLDNQWFIMTTRSNPSVVGDWAAITPWEAALIAINAIAQFPGVTTIQGVLDDCVSGVTAAAGNPFNIQTDDTHDVIAGATATLGNAPPANGSVISGAGGHVLSDGGTPLALYVAPAAGDVVAQNNLVADAGVIIANANGAMAYAAIAGDIIATRAIVADGTVALVTYVAPLAGDVVGQNNVVADAGHMQAGPITAVAHAAAAGDIIGDGIVIGQGGLFAGDTAGDHYIQRIIPFTIQVPANGALADGVTQGAVAFAAAAVGDTCLTTTFAHAAGVGVAHISNEVLGAGNITWTLANCLAAAANYPATNTTGLLLRTVVIA